MQELVQGKRVGKLNTIIDSVTRAGHTIIKGNDRGPAFRTPIMECKLCGGQLVVDSGVFSGSLLRGQCYEAGKRQA